MPFGELMIAPGIVDIGQILVVHGHGAHLVIGRGQDLDDIVPKVSPADIRVGGHHSSAVLVEGI